jgi:hypothetical protein
MMQTSWSGSKLVLPALLLGFAMHFGAQGIIAQESGTKTTTQTTTKTKITIKDGKSVKATGCLTRADTGALMLTGVADKKGPLPDYLLVFEDDKERDLEKHVGHQVQIEGKAANQGDGKVKFEVEEKAKGTSGEENKTERKSEVSGDLKLPLLGVKSVKMLAAACQ